VGDADGELAGRVTGDLLHEVVAQVPDEWLEPAPGREKPDAVREAYVDHLLTRVAAPRRWLPEGAP
jgi:hypothetical protein